MSEYANLHAFLHSFLFVADNITLSLEILPAGIPGNPEWGIVRTVDDERTSSHVKETDVYEMTTLATSILNESKHYYTTVRGTK